MRVHKWGAARSYVRTHFSSFLPPSHIYILMHKQSREQQFTSDRALHPHSLPFPSTTHHPTGLYETGPWTPLKMQHPNDKWLAEKLAHCRGRNTDSGVIPALPP